MIKSWCIILLLGTIFKWINIICLESYFYVIIKIGAVL